MKSRIIGIASIGLVLSLQLSLIGCYSSKILHSPYKAQDETLLVKMKNGRQYELNKWEELPDGTLNGQGREITRQGSRFTGTIPSDSIQVVSVSRFHWGKTVAVTLGIAAGVLAGTLAILSSTWSFMH